MRVQLDTAALSQPSPNRPKNEPSQSSEKQGEREAKRNDTEHCQNRDEPQSSIGIV